MLDKSFDPVEAEARIYKMWEDSGAFKPRAAKPTDTKDDNFSIVIPPPNVTGSLHMGHALNNTIMDILIRFNRMKGKAVLWQPGMDHAGIATQMVVERKLAAEDKYRKNMSREDFLNHVWAWKEESGGIIEQQLRRLGSSCDWSRSKFTLGASPNADAEEKAAQQNMGDGVTKAFVEMYEAGLIYRDKRLVNWDPHFQTAISDLEVETKTVDGHYWHLRYPLADGVTYEHPITDEEGNVTGHETRDHVIVATSRPETMLGDTGVAVHPDDERYAALVGKEVLLPIVGRRVPIIADDYADPEKGSGAVKITPAHDFNDYEVGKRAGHELISILDDRGHILPLDIIPTEFHGLFSVKARKLVVAQFDEAGLLAETEKLKIEQPVGDRSGVVIEPMLTDQWFVDAEKMAKDAVAAVNRGHAHKPNHPDDNRDPSSNSASSAEAGRLAPSQVVSSKQQDGVKGEGDNGTRFIPENWKKTYDHWMENIQPWCVSRQLWWGHQIPAWLPSGVSGLVDGIESSEKPEDVLDFEEHKSIWTTATSKPIVTADAELVSEKIKKLFEGIPEVTSVQDVSTSAWQVYRVRFTTKRGSALHYDFAQDPDVLDTWFSSGLWPFSTLGWPENTEELARFYPTSVLVTAFDIIFFWVARMMMQGLHFMKDENGEGIVPFDDVYIHALVLDEAGKKMSKSIGNTLDPLDLIDGVTSDVLVEKRTRGLKNPDKAPQIAKATRKAYPDGFEPYGADALRFTLASQAGQGRNIRLSVERIAGYRNFGTKLWSAASFGQMNDCAPVAGFDPASATLPVNKWIISETAKTAMEISRCIDTYRFNDAADAAYKFTWDTFCAWYLEFSKPLLSGDDGTEKDETRATFAWVLDQILKLLHPFMPFITEDLWAKVAESRESNLITAEWPTYGEELIDAEAVAELEWLETLITNIRIVRADMNIPPAKKAPLLLVGSVMDPRLTTYAAQLSPMARVERFELADEVPNNALQTVVDGVQYAIPLAGLVDLDEKRKRLTREIEKAQGEIEQIDRKLNNEAFVAKAPEKVVTLQKERRAGYAAEVELLQTALDGLG